MQVRKYVFRRSEKAKKGENLYLINEAISKLLMKMSVTEGEDRIWSLHGDYLEVLRTAGFLSTPEHRLHIAIRPIIERLKPHCLKSRMLGIVAWRMNKKFGKNIFNGFMRELAMQEKHLQQERGIPSSRASKDLSSDEEKIDDKINHHKFMKQYQNSRKQGDRKERVFTTWKSREQRGTKV